MKESNSLKTGEIKYDDSLGRYLCVEHPDRAKFGCEHCAAAIYATGELRGAAPNGGYK